MPTALDAFRTLTFEQQLPLVWLEGTFLAWRWEEEDVAALYHMDGQFFCEVYLEQNNNSALRLHPFTSVEFLEDYTPYIRLDELKE